MHLESYHAILPLKNGTEWEFPYKEDPLAPYAQSINVFLIIVASSGVLANILMFCLSTLTDYGRRHVKNNSHYILLLVSNIADFFSACVLLAGFVKLQGAGKWTYESLCWTLSYLLCNRLA
jgi:hypothetical protein